MDKDEVIQFVSDLVRFDTSINPANGIFPNKNCAEFVKMHGEMNGYEVYLPESYYKGNPDIPLHSVVVAKRGKEKGSTVLFLGHLDVVPVSEAELKDWSHDPFEPVLDDDLLKGRGSGDMKGGVAAFFAAFDKMEIKKGTLVIALSGDEEIGGIDSMEAILDLLETKHLVPDYVINAEGSSTPVIVTKRRGGTQVTFTFDLEMKIVKGTVKERKFKSTLGDGGQSLHSMSFVLGSDTHAMIAAGKFSMDLPVESVTSSSSKTNAVPKEVVLRYVDISGDEDIEYSGGLTKMMHALSSIGSIPLPIDKSKYGPAINPNLCDIDFDMGKASITFDIRSMVQASAHGLIAEEIQRHFAYFGLVTEYSIELAIDPVNVSPDHPLAIRTQEIAEQYGFSIITRGEKLGGASDTRFFTNRGIPGIELGPITYNAHGTNEAVEISSILKLKDIYRQLFHQLVNL